jgi:hypothetical protein
MFTSYSPWYRHSLYPDVTVLLHRTADTSFAQRLQCGKSFMEAGIYLTNINKLAEATIQYFNALSLFKWIVNTNTDKKQVYHYISLSHLPLYHFNCHLCLHV